MHTFVQQTKLIALNQAILKIDVEFFDDVFANYSHKLDLIGTDWVDNVFTNSSDKLDLQDHTISQSTTTNNNIIQQISEKLLLSSHIMERLMSREKNTSTKILERNSLASLDKLRVSTHLDTSSQLSNTMNDNLSSISQLSNTVNDNLLSISQLSNLEQTLPTPELHTPTSIKPNSILSKRFEENSIRNSNTTHSSSTNIHIDKVEVNDVSNVNDLALQLQQKVSTL